MEQGKRDIYDRIYKFAINCIGYVRTFPKTIDGNVIGKQLIRSATSIGANAQEGDGAESKPEFIHRFAIARKEAKESGYWLRIAGDLFNNQRVDLQQEARELALILSSIITKVKIKR